MTAYLAFERAAISASAGPQLHPLTLCLRMIDALEGVFQVDGDVVIEQQQRGAGETRPHRALPGETPCRREGMNRRPVMRGDVGKVGADVFQQCGAIEAGALETLLLRVG